ncbi:MAG TPA: hypothetical protein V6C64_15575, partial [Microcoleaceae cyanobacterium]
MSKQPSQPKHLCDQPISIEGEASEQPVTIASAVVIEASAWDVEVASAELAPGSSVTKGIPRAAIAREVLTADYLTILIDKLRDQSSLPELVMAQLFQHLIETYQQKVEQVVQEQGIEAIDTSLPHFKVVTNRKQGTKRLELVFDSDRIREYLKNSLSEFFTHAGIWQEFAKAVGANLVVWALADLEATQPSQSILPEATLSQVIRKRLQAINSLFLIERSEVLGQIHCQDIAKKILEGFNLSDCSLQDMEKLLGLKQRPPSSTETSLE